MEKKYAKGLCYGKRELACEGARDLRQSRQHLIPGKFMELFVDGPYQ